MATITMTLAAVIDGEQKTITRSATIDDAAMPHFFDAYRAVYGQINGGTEEMPALRAMTDEETFVAYAAGISAGTVANVQNYLREIASRAATESVPEIAATPVPT